MIENPGIPRTPNPSRDRQGALAERAAGKRSGPQGVPRSRLGLGLQPQYREEGN